MTHAEIIAVIDALPSAERLEIADHIYETMQLSDPAIEAAWGEECERRIQAVATGDMRLIPWDEVRSRLRRP
jgi:putative addiction module component (TIGR02574 family)